MNVASSSGLEERTRQAHAALDAHVRKTVAWHFAPETGSPFWLDYAQKLPFDPREKIKNYNDLKHLGHFEDEWLRGGPVRRWLPKGLEGEPLYIFETGGSTGLPKSRLNIQDYKIDYSQFSETLSDETFPKGSDWLMLGPSGPRRLRLAIEHLAQVRGGISFHVDLDPRWVNKLVKAGKHQDLEDYKEHVVDQGLKILRGHDNVKCLFTTPKLLEALCEKISVPKAGITGIFCGGTEMNAQFHRFAREELVPGVDFVPTYGNTLMGLACSKPFDPVTKDYTITYYPPHPRAVFELVDPDDPAQVVDYGETGRVMLTTLTRDFFMPRFLERDQGERTEPIDLYPWDGVSNLRLFSRFEESVVVGVYWEPDEMLHIPLLRAGKPYRSLATRPLGHLGTGEPVAEISQANSGLIAKDLAEIGRARRELEALTTRELVAISRQAGRLFAEADLPLGDAMQSADEYIVQTSATTGLPESMVRANMAKARFVLEEMETVLGGLTRGLDLEILDQGFGQQDGRVVSYRRETDALGAVLPSNSPGVHSLWLPAIPLKTALALRPGSREPWTPYRIAQAFIAAGCPASAFHFYPSDHAGAQQILLRTDRSMLYGDRATVDPWRSNPAVQIHGPGWSKVVFGVDRAGEWQSHLDLIVSSVADNGGRSCINASGVWTPANGLAIADAVAREFAEIRALPLDHPEARLAAFPSRAAAEGLSTLIDSQLAQGGAEDLTARYRSGKRIAEADGCWFLLPTVIFCETPDHPLASAEYLFPFVSVVEVPQEVLLERMGPSLVVTGLTEDPAFRHQLLTSTNVERLNLGASAAMPTSKVAWDQPHEGNLFEHLYRQRSYQGVA